MLVNASLRIWMGCEQYESITEDLYHLVHVFESAVAEWSSIRGKLNI